MKPKIWQNLLYSIFLASTSPGWYCIGVDAVETVNSDTYFSPKLVTRISSTASSLSINEVFSSPSRLTNTQLQPFETAQTETFNQDITPHVTLVKANAQTHRHTDKSKFLSVLDRESKITNKADIVEIAQNDSPLTPPNTEKNDPLPLETIERQPTDFPGPSLVEIEQKLNPPLKDRSQRIKGLLRRLEKNRPREDDRADFSFPDDGENNDLGVLVLQKAPIPPELTQPPAIEQTANTFKPVGYLLGRLGYFNTSNVFSSATDPIDDGLIYSGLTLGSAPIKLGSKTYLNGSIEGNLIRYIEQSQFDYNQIRFNFGIYQQLSPKMYGEIGWNNQQLFYARDSNRFNFASGDRFFNENTFHLSLGRRDQLAPQLTLDSFYELRFSISTTPQQRNRLNNFLWLSLNYSLLKSLKAGINYQFNLSDFTQRTRQDQYHRLYTNLNYSISDFSNISLQVGATLGDSTDSSIDFDGWFFTVNYNWDLGKF